MKNAGLVSLLIFALVASGCASIVRGDEQKLQIKAYDVKSNRIVNADCVVTNDDGKYIVNTDDSVVVKRDKDRLDVKCENDTLKGESFTNGHIHFGYVAVDFFLMDLCLISCWIDGLSGSWAEYDTTINVPMEPKSR